MNFFVNIEISTSKIVGIVANRSEENAITILAIESIATDGCVKRGAVFNIDSTAGKVKRIISLLENKIRYKIGFCYITLNPKGMKGIRHTEKRNLFNNPVTLDIQQELEVKLKQYHSDIYINYSTSNISFMLDGSIVDTPIGKQGTELDAEGSILLGTPAIKKNVTEVLTTKNNIKIHSFIWNPLAQANCLLTADNMQNGCLLLDLGAGTTTATIYKDNILKYSINVPLGSNLITKDIASLGLSYDEAENYKRNIVNLDFSSKDSAIMSDKITSKELNKAVKLRLDEILLNVQERLKESDVFFKLDDGIFLTGGGSLINGMPEYIESLFKMPTQKAKFNQTMIKNISSDLDTPSLYQILGSLTYAQKDCQYIKPIVKVEPKPIEVEPKPLEEKPTVKPENNTQQSTKEKKGIAGFVKDFFSGAANGTFNDGE